MRGKIRFIADVTESEFERADFDEFVHWIKRQIKYQLDIETNVVEKWNEYKLISIQFGSCSLIDRRQYFFQWSALTDQQKAVIKEILEDGTQQKLAHNAKFEYIVLRFHGIIIDNIYDTMLAEKILRGGLENIEYALDDISWKYLRIIMDKSLQQSFGDNIITDPKIVYGVEDVTWLDIIQKMQIDEAREKDLLNVFALEMEALPGFSEMTYNGMELDQQAWRQNIRLAEPLVDEAYKKLNECLLQEPFYKFAVSKGYVSSEDRCLINYGSHQQKAELLKLLFPDIQGGSVAIVRKYIRENYQALNPGDLSILMNYLDKNFDLMYNRLLDEYRQYLVDHGYLVPAGMITINWNSRDQALEVIQQAIPRLRSLAEEEVAKFNHPILDARSNYVDAVKLITTYGEKFIRDHVCSDGKVRTNFNQVVSTGRVSSSSPNMQNIPAKEEVGTRYRNAFVCDPGWVFVDSDYTGQELALIAFASKDPVWLGAIERGEDLHSVCAELVFGKKWRDGQQDGCLYYKMQVGNDGVLKQLKQKCSCKQHKSMRTAVKTINFGLAYGMSEIKLSGTLKITRQEAINLINDYFRVFPGIKKTLDFLGEFGVKNGYIMTFAPFKRKRWFPFWLENRGYVSAHISGIKYNSTLGEIERASKNMPFQGGGGDMVKVAIILIRNYIKENNLWDKVKLVMQVHDQVTTICVAEIAEEWKSKMDELMIEAARLIVPTGILKADTNITPVWTK